MKIFDFQVKAPLLGAGIGGSSIERADRMEARS
jgi:hypothetical protein